MKQNMFTLNKVIEQLILRILKGVRFNLKLCLLVQLFVAFESAVNSNIVDIMFKLGYDRVPFYP